MPAILSTAARGDWEETLESPQGVRGRRGMARRVAQLRKKMATGLAVEDFDALYNYDEAATRFIGRLNARELGELLAVGCAIPESGRRPLSSIRGIGEILDLAMRHAAHLGRLDLVKEVVAAYFAEASHLRHLLGDLLLEAGGVAARRGHLPIVEWGWAEMARQGLTTERAPDYLERVEYGASVGGHPAVLDWVLGWQSGYRPDSDRVLQLAIQTDNVVMLRWLHAAGFDIIDRSYVETGECLSTRTLDEMVALRPDRAWELRSFERMTYTRPLLWWWRLRHRVALIDNIDSVLFAVLLDRDVLALQLLYHLAPNKVLAFFAHELADTRVSRDCRGLEYSLACVPMARWFCSGDRPHRLAAMSLPANARRVFADPAVLAAHIYCINGSPAENTAGAVAREYGGLVEEAWDAGPEHWARNATLLRAMEDIDCDE